MAITFTDYAFDVMWKDELTASVSITNNRKNIEVTKYSNDIAKQPFWGGNIDIYRIYEFLEYRCFEEARPDKVVILELLGLTEYNPWEIVKKTHGRLYEDFLWLRFPGETLTWKDVSNERV